MFSPGGNLSVHSGRAMSGIVGKLRRRFCLFGEWVEPSGARGAARLHSLPCSPPRIPQLSAAPEAAIAAGKLQGT
ncbi:hypothetical protein HaLaN_08128 [Haematococcus lacustris]|uniref:Uncharacterized protein n=1 Tax=Haematococcus lacustris TaxID=44745 RepID=A0A699YZM8_HAELA|nr:hypothetical protein HaLaN_08128 [Haematococcus lacustris]